MEHEVAKGVWIRKMFREDEETKQGDNLKYFIDGKIDNTIFSYSNADGF